MSKWPNTPWHVPPAPGNPPNTWPNPAKQPDGYNYVPPPQNRPYIPGAAAPIHAEQDAANKSANSPPKLTAALPLQKQDPATDEVVPRPIVLQQQQQQQQQPLPHMRPAYGGIIAPPMAQYGPPPMHMHSYQMMPPEYSAYGAYPATHGGEQWDPRHVMGNVAAVNSGPENSNYDRRSSKESASSSPNTDSASMRDSDSSTLDTLQALGSNKPTKRSRMGCLTCRQRKKRCCETRPQCTECQRLRLKCVWPKPGTEHKNKPKEVKCQENMIDHEEFGKIKVLRGIVEYRSD